MTRIYRYVLETDSGMAPNPSDDLITLVTCKPGIRRMAKPGDWALGNLPSPHNIRLAWAGRIAECMALDDYAKRHPDRRDALMERSADGCLKRIPGKLAWYHPEREQQRKDLTGNALVFDMASSWYFGADARTLPDELQHLVARGQGYRVNNRQSGDLNRLEGWLQEQGPPGIHGEPRDGWADARSGSSKSCGRKPRVIKKRNRC